MKSLIRNCLHGSDIFITEEYDHADKTLAFYKSSSRQKGIGSLRKELNGFQWYKEQLENNIEISIENETPFYLKLKSKFIEGNTYPYIDGFSKNKVHFPSIIDHYCCIWLGSKSKNELFNLHGDFTIENIIFHDSLPIVIDWEHFCYSICPLGFDGLNLLFDQLWYESDEKRVSQSIIEELAQLILILRERGALAPCFWDSPLKKMKNFIQENLCIWNGQESKLPVLKFTNKEISIIDTILGKVLN